MREGTRSVVFLILVLFACQHEKTVNMPTLSAVKEGQLLFSDGSVRPIPHWGDTAYVIMFLVRHAEKAQDGVKDPELSAEGQARAERLGRIMEASQIDSVYATMFKRARSTAEPVQRRAHCPAVESYEPENIVGICDDLLKNALGKHIFIVGHQSTVPLMLNYLTGDFAYKNIGDYDYGRFYVAITDGIGETEVIETTY